MVAPLLIILGLWTRIGALLIALNMVVAIGLEAWHLALIVNRNGGWGIELEAFYLLCAIAVFFLGAGKYRVGRAKGALA